MQNKRSTSIFIPLLKPPQMPESYRTTVLFICLQLNINFKCERINQASQSTLIALSIENPVEISFS